MTTQTIKFSNSYRHILRAVGTVGAGFGHLVSAISHLHRARRVIEDYEYYARMSDEQLAEAGLRRDRIGQVLVDKHFADL